MANKYEEIIKTALDNYSKHAERPGYPDGFFTACRHSFRETEDITTFINAVKNKPETTAKKMIEIRLANFPQNNHSFNAYLLDQLIKNFPEERWETHNQRAIIYYNSANNTNSYLYRGSFEKPNVIFSQGFKSYKNSTKIEDYADACNLSTGISTTKQKNVAQGYATQFHGGRIKEAPKTIDYGYIYKIDPKGLSEKAAIDIVPTWKIRSNLSTYSFFAQFINDAQRKQEVNFTQSIPTKNIVGYYLAREPSRFFANPNYPLNHSETQSRQTYENNDTGSSNNLRH